MAKTAMAGPKASELYIASLVATALVYGFGIFLIAILLGLTSPSSGLRDAAVFLAFFTTVGFFAALCVGFVIVAPLGIAIGKIMLGVTPPAWWQGPVTGLLVALVFVPSTLALIRLTGEPLDMGTYAVAFVPIVLAPFAGALVQQRFLHWPTRLS